MIRVVLPALILLGACSTFERPTVPTPSVRSGTGPDAELIAACRREAERQILYNDRGQWARNDEALGLSDVTNNIPSMRIRSDSGNLVLRRDQMVQDCVRQNRGGPQPVDARGATPSSARTTRR